MLRSHPIAAKIADTDWLTEFQEGRVVVRPCDYLRVRLQTKTTYQGTFGNPLLHYTVLKVLDVKRT